MPHDPGFRVPGTRPKTVVSTCSVTSGAFQERSANRRSHTTNVPYRIERALYSISHCRWNSAAGKSLFRFRRWLWSSGMAGLPSNQQLFGSDSCRSAYHLEPAKWLGNTSSTLSTEVSRLSPMIESVSCLVKHVCDDVAAFQPGSEFACSTEAGNCGKFMLKIWLASN